MRAHVLAHLLELGIGVAPKAGGRSRAGPVKRDSCLGEDSGVCRLVSRQP